MTKHSTLHTPFELSRLAQHITSSANWSSLTLPQDLVAKLQDFCRQAQHSRTPLTLKSKSTKCACALFTGPRSSCKTLAAEVIAHALRSELYRVDLSAVVSKYIGETEKNLRQLFDAAKHSNVILFFDEADALFGERSEVKDSHDRYANMEVSYLLQLMENHKGLLILTSNNKDTLDQALVRRLCSLFEFPLPKSEERPKP